MSAGRGPGRVVSAEIEANDREPSRQIACDVALAVGEVTPLRGTLGVMLCAASSVVCEITGRTTSTSLNLPGAYRRRGLALFVPFSLATGRLRERPSRLLASLLGVLLGRARRMMGRPTP